MSFNFDMDGNEENYWQDEEERCYEETRIAAHEKLGQDAYGVILNYDCGCSSLFWVYLGEKKPNDHESYEEAIAENACPHCGHNASPIEYKKPIATAPTLHRTPESRSVKVETSAGFVQIGIETGHIDGSHQAIAELIRSELCYDDISHVSNPKEVLTAIGTDIWESQSQQQLF